MDKALFGVILRGGLRVSEVVKLTLARIDWDQGALFIVQGKGQKDRRVFLSSDAMASLRACAAVRPRGVPHDAVFWNRKRPHVALSVKAVQKKIERYAKAAGIHATCHQLRHTFASNLLEHGAEIVSINPTTPLYSALCLSSFAMGKIGPVITPLHPRNEGQDFFNGIRPQGQDHCQDCP
jgi:site-specific recombinase XerD